MDSSINSLDTEDKLMGKEEAKTAGKGEEEGEVAAVERGSARKMTPLQAYFALLKAYCAINVLLLPKAVRNGGYALSPAALAISCCFEGTCAVKLSKCGSKTKKISYSDIVQAALGPKIQPIFEGILAFVQF